METRANNVWVGAVTLALLALAAGFALWLAHLSNSQRKSYDIYFRQSVDGLAKGTQVSYAGVPSGQITEIELSHNDPGLVRVRVALNPDTPVLQGTTATIQGSFTGVSNVQLAGGVAGAPPIRGMGPDGAPVIPTKRSGLGELLSNAPQLMAQITALTERVSNLLSDKNQKAFAGILSNTERLTSNVADATPQLAQSLADLDQTLVQARDTLAEFQKVAGNVNGQLDSNGPSLARQLSDTLKAAQGAADALKATAGQADPAVRRITMETLPQAEAAVRELRATSKALRELTEKIDNQGAAAALGAPKLPEYHP
jgi:phospholipid/cholesterol/gamma-HCH transport system substrate-binding protein